MANPQITAIVSAEDKASATLRAIAELSKRVASELEKTGNAGGGNGLKKAFDDANASASAHLSRLHAIRDAFKGMSTAAAAYAAYKFPHVAKDALQHYLPIDREERAMKAAGNYSEADMALLRKQQTALATKYGERPESVVHAQSEFVKRHMDAATAAAMTEEGVKLAKALGTTAQKGAQILEGMIFGTGEHVNNPADARRLGKRFSDIAAVQSKQGAMSAADIEGAWKYAASATTAAGITPEQVAAVMMVQKREQFSGDESGVFWRQMAARIMMPTAQGRIAMAAGGIQYDQFVQPGKMRAAGFNVALAEAGQKELPPAEITALQKKVEEGAFKTKADFSRHIRDAYERVYGDTSAKDLNVIGKRASSFFESSKGMVNGSALWAEMLKKLTPQQILEIIGVKQGAKGISVLQQLQQNKEYEEALKNSAGIAERIVNERMEGLAASVDRLSATYDDSKNQFVAANSNWIIALTNAAQKTAEWAGGLNTEQKHLVTLGGAAATLAGSMLAYKTSIDLARKILGPAGAAAGTGGAAAGAAGAVSAGLGWLYGSIVAGGAALSYAANNVTKQMVESGVKPEHFGGGNFALAAGIMGAQPEKGPHNDPIERAIVNSVKSIFGPVVDTVRGLPDAVSGKRPWAGPEGTNSLFTTDGGFASGKYDGGGFQRAWGAGGKQDVSVSGDVQGSVDIHQSMTVEPSPWFMTKINLLENAQASIRGAISGDKLGSSMKGSNATRSPGSGMNAFKPTMSGF